MSSGESPVDRLVAFAVRPPARPPRPAGVDIALTAATYVALIVVMLPLTRVVATGPWTWGVLLLPPILLATGWLARRRRLPAVAVSLAETVVGLVAVVVLFLRDTALLGILPTPRSVGEASELVVDAVDQIVNGAAPLEARAGLEFLIVGGMLLLTVIVDHVVLTARMPLLAAIALIAVWLIPSIAVPREIDLIAFVLLAAVVLLILRLETSAREQDAAPPPPRSRVAASTAGGIAAAATGIGAVAVVVALVIAPVFSGLVIRPGAGAATRWNTIDPTLQLGDDLRRASNGEVLRVRTTGGSAPYLRVATLSAFDGEEWRPDRGATAPIDEDGAITASRPADDIRVVETTTSIDIVNLVSGSAPVAYPISAIDGLDGDWESLPSNGTIVSRTTNVNGQDYEFVAQTPRPTLEQIRASRATTAGVAAAAASGVYEETRILPPDLPPIIAQTAAEVTAGTETDYDALLALQRWFRSSQFEYSLEAPVEDGFDGSGAEAVAAFLDVRAGYCVHFASAFALMARTLGMPARIVVGYLPGSALSDPMMGNQVYSVMSSQLHAWPEVYFSGIGWVPFEPTKSLGTATSFSPAFVATDPLDPDAETGETPLPTASPTASLRPEGIDERGSEASSSANPVEQALPWMGPLFGILVVLAIPSVIRAFRRRDLMSAARAGDAGAAWRSLQEEAIDLGIPVPPDESPRAFGARLVRRSGAPDAAVQALVEAIEHASYSRSGSTQTGIDLAAVVKEVCAGLTTHAVRRARVLALLAPRSLLIRPGSVYAGDGALTRR
ncbi:transglutaminase TgpA family protein [Microbacterium ulmi]|uniref:Transglutaminase domain-containing protein n=1 Tax=Microbacterium ulmi TaxID=179095 RepID=A0A7Y2M2X6_9MICO|nr:DUF3488 and transglutaminase-like domain-containing protein [Microbacterium ulmi]NII68583.1 transglutaminase-like putative cysteine protease [Microbacterium ulmi]NNH05044.1 transglutaminase domain-containing protein [Microbacterium ulmi]